MIHIIIETFNALNAQRVEDPVYASVKNENKNKKISKNNRHNPNVLNFIAPITM